MGGLWQQLLPFLGTRLDASLEGAAGIVLSSPLPPYLLQHLAALGGQSQCWAVRVSRSAADILHRDLECFSSVNAVTQGASLPCF